MDHRDSLEVEALMDHRDSPEVEALMDHRDSPEVEALQAIQDTPVVKVWDTLVVEGWLVTPVVAVEAVGVERLEILTVANPTAIMVGYPV